MAKLLIESPFPPDECRRRLAAATEPDRFGAYLKFSEGVLARIHQDGFRLRLRRAHVRNAFTQLLHGRYQTTTHGSLLEVRPGLHPSVLAVTIIWFSLLGLWTVFHLDLIIDGMRGGQPFDSGPWAGLVAALGLAACSILLVQSGGRDFDELLEFVKRVLVAQPTERRAP